MADLGTAIATALVRGGVSPQQTAVDLRVQFGRPRLSGSGGERRRVKAVKVHPRFTNNEHGSAYDVAVLTLSEPVTSIEPVELARPKDGLSGTDHAVTRRQLKTVEVIRIAGWRVRQPLVA